MPVDLGPNCMNSLLLKIWRFIPFKLQLMISGLVRPKYHVAVAAIILDERGRLLLCKHTYRQGLSWGIPAGNLEYGEDPEQAIVRELREETGLQITVQKLLAVESAKDFHHVSVVYSCKTQGGAFVPSAEVSAIQYFDLTGLPALKRSERQLIERVLSQP